MAAPQQRAPFYLPPQQLQMLHFLQQNVNSLTSQQQGLLKQLQYQYRLMQEHQQQIRQQQQAGQRGLRPGQPGYPTAYSHPQNLGQSSGVVKNFGIPQQPVNIQYSYFFNQICAIDSCTMEKITCDTC